MANLRKLMMWPAIALVGAGCIGASYYKRYRADQQFAAEVSRARDEARRIEREVVQFTKRTLPSGGSFAAFLGSLGIDSHSASRMIAAAQPVFDMRHLRAGNEFSIGRSVLGELREVRYNIEPGRILSIAPSGNDFRSTIETVPSRTDEVGVMGRVDGSLFQAVTDAGEKPELAMRIAEIFGFDLRDRAIRSAWSSRKPFFKTANWRPTVVSSPPNTTTPAAPIAPYCSADPRVSPRTTNPTAHR
jgi:hypothetical protein